MTRDLAEQRGGDTPVYQPAEDSYLLAEACEEHLVADMTVLDIGTGSGVVADHLREAVGVWVVGVDINPHACRQAADRGLPVVRANLVDPFRADAFDALVCNPPYLPTEPDAERNDWLATALSGGETGRRVVEALLPDAARVLRNGGAMYLLVSSLMDVSAVKADATEAGFTVDEIARDEGFPFEVLSVLELRR